jgi:hypothetical protein
MSAEAVFDDDQELPALLDVADRNAASPAGPTPESLHYDGVAARIGRPRDADPDRHIVSAFAAARAGRRKPITIPRQHPSGAARA